VILDWSGVEADVIDRLWELLLDWTEWAAGVYPSLRAALKPCWAEHPEVVRELVAYMTWWENVYHPAAGERGDNGFGAVDWHEHLPALTQRLHAALKPCSTDQCWRRSEFGSYEGSRLARPACDAEPAAFIRLWEAPHPE
jgi:hypothetical protein